MARMTVFGAAASLPACAAFLLLTALPSVAAPASGADAYPSKPVRIIIGFPPGGATDLVARIIAPKYADLFKQQFIVDNRPGANGTIASGITAKSPPDGYTLHLATIGSLVITPAIQKVPYDPLKDFAPVSQVVSLQNIFIVHPTLPVHTLKELIALARSKPGKLNYASSGTGSPGHLAGELFKTMARVDMVHIPYKGGGPAMTDLIAGHIEIFVAVVSTAIPQVQAGKARALAVTGTQRVQALPNVPTVAQAGLKGYEATNWYGLVAPAGTPQIVIDRLHKETATILAMPDVQKALRDRGIDVAPSLPEQFSAYIKAETTKWASVIKAAKLDAK